MSNIAIFAFMLLFEMHFLSLCHPVVPVIGSGIFLRSTVYLLMATQNIQLKGFGDDQTNKLAKLRICIAEYFSDRSPQS